MPTPTANHESLSRGLLIGALLVFVADFACVVREQHTWSTDTLSELARLSLPGLGILLLGVLLRRPTSREKSGKNTSQRCFSHLPIPAVVVNRRGRICNANPAATRLVGLHLNALLNRPVHKYFHPPQSTPENCKLCQHIKAGLDMPADDFAFAKPLWQQISLSRMTKGKSERLLQLHFDISNRKQAEERMALVLDGAELGYWDWDYVNGKYQVNQRWLEMLGLEKDDLD
ncbi:MAG: PAS domain S-box protein, partial [Methylomonas sp.]|nr:PAS domain S-box protein [Methylomonas sp.]